MKYYILDYGKNVEPMASKVLKLLMEETKHVVVYLTDLDNALMVQEVEEDEFLNHYVSSN